MVNSHTRDCDQRAQYWRAKIRNTVSVVVVALWTLLVAAQQSSADALGAELKRLDRLERKAAQDREAGITPLHDAVVRGDIAALEAVLQSGAPVNQPDAFYRTPLYLAAEAGDVRAIELLVKAGARVNTGGALITDGWVPLSGASFKGHVAAIEALLNAGAKITGAELQAAALSGHVPAIRALLKAGADVNAPYGYSEETPLHSASSAGQLTAIEALLQAGSANVNARDGLGDTPLHETARMGEVAATQALLEAGAEVNVQTDSGQTPLGVAREQMDKTIGSIIPYQEVIKILQQHGGQ